jgi:diguanylate cyclase (GGDEF)-like protein
MNIKTLNSFTKDLNILFVEDNKNILYEVSKVFEMLFATVTVCKNGEEGLAAYREKENFFDIVLTDIKMPIMDGLEMIKYMRYLNPTQHVMVLSAQDYSINLRQLINLGIDGFVQKPIDKNELKNSLYKVSKIINNEKKALKYNEQLLTSNNYLEKVVQKRTLELKEQFFVDKLTGFQNRTALIDNLNNDKFTLMAMNDIDRLQFINSLYGVVIGNKIIKKFAKIIHNELKFTNYSLFKTSGDEFAICSNDKDSLEFENCIKIISKKVTNLPLYIEEIDDNITVDATIGYTLEFSFLAEFDMTYDSHLLLAQSDAALKYAKKNNKALVSYDEKMNVLQDMQNIMLWKQMIKTAYESDNIIPVFQPIVNSDGEILKYETLMRLRDTEAGKSKLISPFFFLDIAIMTKQYALLSKKIISGALEHLKYSKHTLSINLTYSDIQNPDISILLEEALKKSDIGDRLVIEIVESEDVSDYNLLQKFIQRFRKYNVRIAIDDFGSGFSNFKNIIDFKPDYLKIDGSLIKNIDNDANSLAIVKCIVQFAHNINIKVIAEYVHSAEVLQVLKNLNIDEYQGFYFYEPALEFVSEEVLV